MSALWSLQETAEELEQDMDGFMPDMTPLFNILFVLFVVFGALVVFRLIRYSTRPPRRRSSVPAPARGWWTRDPHGRWRTSIRSWWFRDR